jgi:hypothetical protein
VLMALMADAGDESDQWLRFHDKVGLDISRLAEARGQANLTEPAREEGFWEIRLSMGLPQPEQNNGCRPAN